MKNVKHMEDIQGYCIVLDTVADVRIDKNLSVSSVLDLFEYANKFVRAHLECYTHEDEEFLKRLPIVSTKEDIDNILLQAKL